MRTVNGEKLTGLVRALVLHLSTFVDKCILSTIVDGMSIDIDLPEPTETEQALAAVVALRRLAERLERRTVDHAIETGWTWQQIADELGISRQAVHKRHNKRRKLKGA